MAKCYFFHDTRSKTTDRWPLQIRVSHKKKRPDVPTGFYLTKEEWDDANNLIKAPFKNAGRANKIISSKLAIALETIETFRHKKNAWNAWQYRDAIQKAIDVKYGAESEEQQPQVLEEGNKSLNPETVDFLEYMQSVANDFYIAKREGSAKIMERTITSLKKFTGKSRFAFAEVTVDFLKDYEAWFLNQLNRKGKKNTISGLGFQTKEIRRVYNMAILDESLPDVTTETYPFGRGKYKVRTEKTENKNVSEVEIAKILNLELPPESALWHHQNFFTYYFECWGMNFLDCAFLRVHQVQGGQLHYVRRKTSWSENTKKFNIKHSKRAQQIIDYYTKDKAPSDLVFPILDKIIYLQEKETGNREEDLENRKLFATNLGYKRSNHIRRLSTLSKKAGLEQNVSTYVGRHSFFNIALNAGVPKSQISEMAGHSNYAVTEGYLAGFSQQVLSQQAEIVRNSIAQKSQSSKSLLKETQVLLEATGEQISLLVFLDKVASGIDDQSALQTRLVLELLSQTEIKDHNKAIRYAKLYLGEA